MIQWQLPLLVLLQSAAHLFRQAPQSVTSTKSSGSSGNIELFVAKDEDNGDGTFDRYTDSKSWNSSLTFADFGNYNLSPVGNYYVQFESTRYSTGTVAAATLKNIYVTVYYH